MELIRTNGTDINFLGLVKLLDEELWDRYPEINHLYVDGNIIEDNAYVILLMHNGKAIGCGCLRPFNSGNSIELKRVFVKQEFRGQKLSKKIINELILLAKEKKYNSIKLETGKRQPESISLYKNTGFKEIENYGKYEGMEASICMELLL